jgi:hypothetical protein
LGNPLVANQSTANGPNWVEYLTTNYNTTVTLSYDFAISGVSIPDGFSYEILNLYEPRFASLFANSSSGNSSSSVGQHVTTSAGSGISWNSNSSIFASWIGINDINWCSLLFSPTPEVGFLPCLTPRMDEYFILMDSLYNTGAGNFVFVNMPPLQRAPMVAETNQTVVENYAEGVALFNDHLLPKYVANFTSTYTDVRTIVYDAHSFFSEILDHPGWYGFKNNYCYSCIGCYNVTGCFWANNYHPVWQVHEKLAQDMVANLTAVGWPLPQPVML